MRTLRRMAWQRWPKPMDSESPSPETPMYTNSRLAALAPVAMGGMRPCAELNPCAPLTQYEGVFDEQPMRLSLAIIWGGVAGSHRTRVMAAVIESCRHPPHSVDMRPWESRI